MTTFAIYADPLRIFTSSAPQRGLIRELIRLRTGDHFIFFLNSRFENDTVVNDYFKSLHLSANWSLRIIESSYLLMRVLQVAGFSFPKLDVKADLYISPDVETFGSKAKPVVNFLPDMSVYDDNKNTSLSLLNTLFRKRSIAKMNKNTNRLIVVSEFTANRYLCYFPESKNKVTVIYNGIDDLWFTSGTYSISEETFWIWMGGSYNSRKNLDRLFDAYDILLQSNTALPKIMVVGIDEMSRMQLEKYLNEKNLLNRVIIKPRLPLSELIALVDASRGLLFPSLYEGFGLPIIEVFARGKPVMLADITSLPEIANDLGILCDPHSTESILEGLKAMLATEDTIKVIAERREWASQFTYERATYKFNEIVNLLLDKNTSVA